MIHASLPHLHALHVRAVEALEATGIHPGTLQFPSELPEVLSLAYTARHELHAAWTIAMKAGVVVPVEALTEPATEALDALIDGILEEAACQRRSHAAE